MADWYRNREWNADIAAAFEAKLARARRKAEYLSLQGQSLIGSAPETARELLRRAVSEDDKFETVRALAYLAQANLALGDVAAALDAYEHAIERQLECPNIVAVSLADYAFAVGYWRRTERLPVVAQLADALPVEGLFGPDPQALAARAMIRALIGHAGAAEDARRALELMADWPDVAALGIGIAELRERMAEIAAA
jgi:tetratricopeptide (TPR) repeat protein